MKKTDDSEDEKIKDLLDGGAAFGRKLTMGEQMESLLQENESLRILARKLYRENKELKQAKRGANKTGIILIVIGIILLLVFAYKEIMNYRSALKVKQLQEQRLDSYMNGDSIELTDILPEYRKMYKTNSDLVGWIVIDGTDVNYPVVQSKVNQEYYLNHDFDGEEDDAGSIFADARNDVFKPDDNVIIYGHNMKNGSMFGTLQYYLKKDYYNKHKTISFDTLYKRRTYEIIAVGLSKIKDESDNSFKYYDYLNAKDKSEFEDYAKNIKKLAAYDTKKQLKYGDKLITLSTCNSVEKDGRLFLVARMKG